MNDTEEDKVQTINQTWDGQTYTIKKVGKSLDQQIDVQNKDIIL